MTNAPTPPSSRQVVPRWRLWFGLVAPTAAWAVHGLSSYYLAMEVCHVEHPNLAAGRAGLIAITVVALSFAVAGFSFAWRSWRQLSDESLLEAEGRGVDQMMAVGGLFVSATFIVGILWGGLPSLLLFKNLCEAWR